MNQTIQHIGKVEGGTGESISQEQFAGDPDQLKKRLDSNYNANQFTNVKNRVPIDQLQQKRQRSDLQTQMYLQTLQGSEQGKNQFFNAGNTSSDLHIPVLPNKNKGGRQVASIPKQRNGSNIEA